MSDSKPPRPQPLWLTEQDVGACVDLNEAIAALEQGLRLEAEGKGVNVDKALATWTPASSMHALGSTMAERGFGGFKTWANTPAGAAASFCLFDTHDGRLLALIEAGLLGALRTAGISGLATRLLAEPEADEMALLGTGRQAMMQVAAVAATRPLRRLRVWSRTPDNRATFAAQARRLFPFAVDEAETVRDALADMPIVTLITRATEPFVEVNMIARGAHVNAAGAILPANAEAKSDVFLQADLVVVDSLSNARKASRELLGVYGSEPEGWAGVKTLGDVIALGSGRPAGANLTLFKPMGMGLSDLCMAIAVYQRSIEEGRGLRLPAAHMPAPRWTLAEARELSSVA